MPWHRAYVSDFEAALKEKCGYSGVQPYWDWTLGAILASSSPAALTRFATDSSNFRNSSFFDPDPSSGLGSWGDPKNDYQLTDGGLADVVVSYPVPHRIRRNYTLYYPDLPNFPLTNSFTPESLYALVHGFKGDFIAFQAHFETAAHGAVHRIVGGCVNLFPLRPPPLTGPIQRSLWCLSIERSSPLYPWPQVVPQWCALLPKTRLTRS